MFTEKHAARTLAWLFFCSTLSSIVPTPDRRAEKLAARSEQLARECLDVAVGQRLFSWECYRPLCRGLLFREVEKASAEHMSARRTMVFEWLAVHFEGLVQFEEESAKASSRGVFFFSNSVLQCLIRTLAESDASASPVVQACRVACKICDSDCARLQTNLMLTLHDSLPDVEVRERGCVQN